MIEYLPNETHWAELRRRAEQSVAQSSPDARHRQDNDMARLIHEIRVNQAELEMQNDELLKSRDTIETARYEYEQLYRKYANLFDFSPVGYLVINDGDLIQELNLVASILFDTPRSKLIGRRATDFIHRDDQELFFHQKQQCKKTLNTSDFELKIKTKSRQLMDIRLQLVPINNKNDNETNYILALTDISALVHLSSSAHLQQRCLELANTDQSSELLVRHHVWLITSHLDCHSVGVRICQTDDSIPFLACEGFGREWVDCNCQHRLEKDTCLYTTVMGRKTDASRPYYTPHGSFYINSVSRFMATASITERAILNPNCPAHKYESIAMVPIVVNQTIIGLIHMADHREFRFPLRVVETMEQVASRLGLAINRLDLQASLSNSLSALDDLSKHLVDVQENERQRISMDLHDSCGQNLNALKLQIRYLREHLSPDDNESIQRCDQMLHQADTIINDVRAIAQELKPSSLKLLGLSSAIRELFRKYAFKYELQVDKHIALLDLIEDDRAEINLYRIFQEALSNIDKHAQATRVTLVINRNRKALSITIKDNGIGIESGHCLAVGPGRNGMQQGMGFPSMALRCRIIGADFSIDSQSGKGTRLTICIPCPGKEADP